MHPIDTERPAGEVPTSASDEPDFRFSLRIRIAIIALAALVGIGGGVIWAWSSPPRFTSQGEVQITVESTRDSPSDLEIAARTSRQLAVTYAVVATSSSVTHVARDACARSDQGSVESRAYAVQGTSIIRFEVTSATEDCTSGYASSAAEALAAAVTDTENSGDTKVAAAIISDPADNVHDSSPAVAFFAGVGMLFGLSIGLLIGLGRAPRRTPTPMHAE